MHFWQKRIKKSASTALHCDAKASFLPPKVIIYQLCGETFLLAIILDLGTPVMSRLAVLKISASKHKVCYFEGSFHLAKRFCGLQVRWWEWDTFKIFWDFFLDFWEFLGNFLGGFFLRNLFGGIFWEKFFGRIFWEEFFGRNSLGGFLWEDFFGRNSFTVVIR